MKTPLLLIAALFLSFNVFSQGIVRGKITDQNGEGAFNAVISLKNKPTVGTTADFDGNYSLEIPESGTHTITVNYFGFEPVDTTVVIGANKVVLIDFDLVPKGFMYKGVEIEAKANKAGTNYMEKIKANEATTLDYVSSETLARTGDSNVSSGIKRVTGVSTVGSFVSVRGLADRYIKTTLNGSRIPTLDPLTNNIKLDIFPTGLVDNLVITKTMSPEYPGDWSGAFISVETKDYPDKLTIELSTSFGYNPQTTFKDVVSSEKSKTDWLGFDNGFRDVPDGIPTVQSEYPIPVLNSSYWQQFESLGLASYLNSYGITSDTPITEGNAYYQLAMIELGLMGPAQFNNSGAVSDAITSYESLYGGTFFGLFNSEISDYGQRFNNTWFTKRRKAPMNNSTSINIGNQTKIFKKTFGYLVGFRYYNNTDYDGSSINQRTSASPGFEPEAGSSEDPAADELDLDQKVSNETNGWSALANLALKLNNNHNISFLVMPNFIGVNTARTYVGTDNVTSGGELIFGEDQQYEERQQIIYQLKSEHVLPDSTTKIEFNTSYTDGMRNILDFKDLRYNYLPISQEYSMSSSAPARRYRYMNENLLDSRISVEMKVGKKKINPSKFGFGGGYQYNERKNQQVQYTVLGIANDPVSEDIILNNQQQLFAPSRFSIAGQSGFDLYYVNGSSNLDSDIGISKIISGFAMIDHHFSERIRFVAGARIEKTDIEVDIQKYYEEGLPVDSDDRQNIGGVKANPGLVDTLHILPSANFIYKIANEEKNTLKNIRFNYFRSLARPGFRELSAVSLEDFELRSRIQGNPNLEMTNINNLDFRFETYYKETGSSFFVSLFYKQFTNHIELVKVAGGNDFTWQNVENSNAVGLEIEGRKKLTRNFEAAANVSFIDSQTTITEPITETRNMFGQAPYIVNAILTYTGDSARFSTSLSYNVQGPKLAAVVNVTEDIPDIYELPRHMIDYTLSYKISKHFNLGFQIKNVLNAPIRRSYKFDEGFLLDFDRYTYGTNYQLTFTYKL
jgi:CarboxypepD_reg-like domain